MNQETNAPVGATQAEVGRRVLSTIDGRKDASIHCGDTSDSAALSNGACAWSDENRLLITAETERRAQIRYDLLLVASAEVF